MLNFISTKSYCNRRSCSSLLWSWIFNQFLFYFFSYPDSYLWHIACCRLLLLSLRDNSRLGFSDVHTCLRLFLSIIINSNLRSILSYLRHWNRRGSIWNRLNFIHQVAHFRGRSSSIASIFIWFDRLSELRSEFTHPAIPTLHCLLWFNSLLKEPIPALEIVDLSEFHNKPTLRLAATSETCSSDERLQENYFKFIIKNTNHSALPSERCSFRWISSNIYGLITNLMVKRLVIKVNILFGWENPCYCVIQIHLNNVGYIRRETSWSIHRIIIVDGGNFFDFILGHNMGSDGGADKLWRLLLHQPDVHFDKLDVRVFSDFRKDLIAIHGLVSFCFLLFLLFRDCFEYSREFIVVIHNHFHKTLIHGEIPILEVSISARFGLISVVDTC